jgi:hypothetical protein
MMPVSDEMNKVEKPTEVKFNESEQEFVFNAAFSGWHSSALAVSLEADDGARRDEEGEESDEAEGGSKSMPGGFSSARERVGLARLGLPARGRMGGGT